MEKIFRKKRAITTKAYQLMIREGVLTKNDKVELIHGEIIEKMSPIGSKHSSIVDILNAIIVREIQSDGIVRIQSFIELTETSQPEPDLSILKYTPSFYYHTLPKVEDVLLLIEVSDSTIDYDREVKLPLYAEAGIPVLWIVDVEKEVVEVYSQPNKGRYRFREFFSGDDILQLSSVGFSIEVNSIFPTK